MTEATLVDVLIVGAGPVGMTLALALSGSGLRVRLLDRRPPGALLTDARALALSQGARQVLEPLGVWPGKAATAIENIHISQRGGFGRTLMQSSDYALPALGYVVRYRALADALHHALPSDMLLAAAALCQMQARADNVDLTVDVAGEVQHWRARLLVHAEGTPPEGGGMTTRDYQQHAVIAEVTVAEGHNNRAWERFTPDGPLALLPLDKGFSVVFTVPPEKADHLMRMNDADFLAALQQQFGKRLTFQHTGARTRFPLVLRLRQNLVGARQVWIGNAAQTLHPVSGQGFNLGLRDACALAQHLLHGGDDVGDPHLLSTYARERRLDRWGGALFTDGIVRLFSNDLPGLRQLRGLGLLALDTLPLARHFVAKRMIWGARAWP